MHLPMQDQRIHRLARIVSRGVLEDLDGAGVRIHLDLADGAARGIGGDAAVEGLLRGQRNAQIVGKRGVFGDGAGKIENIEALVVADGLEEAILEIHIGSRNLHQRRRHQLALCDDGLAGLHHQGAGEAHGAIRMGAAARFHQRGVAAREPHIPGRDAQHIRHHLGEARLVALTRRLSAHHQLDAPFGIDRQLHPLMGRAHRRLHGVGEADAREFAALARRRPPRLKAIPVGELQRQLQIAQKIAAVIAEARRGAIGQRRPGNQVAAAQRDAVDPHVLRGHVEQALDHQRRLWPPRAAIGCDGDRVAHGAAQTHACPGDVINRGAHPPAVMQGRKGEHMGADVADDLHIVSDDPARRVETEPALGDAVAALIVGEAAFVALAGPFHRTAHDSGGPEHAQLLGVAVDARAKTPAHIGGDDAQALGGQVHRRANAAAQAMHALTA